eukprot:Opistho-1_new@58599
MPKRGRVVVAGVEARRRQVADRHWRVAHVLKSGHLVVRDSRGHPRRVHFRPEHLVLADFALRKWPFPRRDGDRGDRARDLRLGWGHARKARGRREIILRVQAARGAQKRADAESRRIHELVLSGSRGRRHLGGLGALGRRSHVRGRRRLARTIRRSRRRLLYRLGWNRFTARGLVGAEANRAVVHDFLFVVVAHDTHGAVVVGNRLLAEAVDLFDLFDAIVLPNNVDFLVNHDLAARVVRVAPVEPVRPPLDLALLLLIHVTLAIANVVGLVMETLHDLLALVFRGRAKDHFGIGRVADVPVKRRARHFPVPCRLSGL